MQITAIISHVIRRSSLLLCATVLFAFQVDAQGLSARVVGQGFSEPISAAVLPGSDEPARVLVLEAAGALKILDTANGKSKKVAEVVEAVPGETITALDVVAHPEFEKNRQAIVSYHLAIDANTCFFNVKMIAVPEAMDPSVPRIVKEILREPQPCGSAHGGGLSIGPNEQLFIGFGTGKEILGEKTAQSKSSLNGKILRLRLDDDEPYTIPDDNPYVDVGEESAAIWALGFRDPRRLSFDSKTGLVAVVDHGTGLAEEINFARAKGNYGWPMFEGSECQMMRFDCIGRRLRSPVFTASGSRGAALAGGAVLRQAGHRFDGRYLFFSPNKNKLYAISLDAPKGNRIEMPVNFAVDTLVAGPNASIVLLDTKQGVVREVQ